MNWNIVMSIIFIIWIFILFSLDVIQLGNYQVLINPFEAYLALSVFCIAIFLQLLFLTWKVEKLIRDKEKDKNI